jgi:hypothetical protein
MFDQYLHGSSVASGIGSRYGSSHLGTGSRETDRPLQAHGLAADPAGGVNIFVLGRRRSQFHLLLQALGCLGAEQRGLYVCRGRQQAGGPVVVTLGTSQ